MEAYLHREPSRIPTAYTETGARQIGEQTRTCSGCGLIHYSSHCVKRGTSVGLDASQNRLRDDSPASLELADGGEGGGGGGVVGDNDDQRNVALVTHAYTFELFDAI